MKKLKVLSLLLMMFVLFSSNTTSDKTKEYGFKLIGTTKGIKDGKKLILETYMVEGAKKFTAIVKDNKFEMSGDIKVPHEYWMRIEGVEDGTTFCILYPENTTMKMHWDNSGDFPKYTVSGGSIQEEHNALEKKKKELSKAIGLDQIGKVLKKETEKGEISKETQEKYMDIQMKYFNEERNLLPKYIKENPKSLYSAIQIALKAKGKNADSYEKMIKDNLDPSLNSTSLLKNMRKQIAKLRKDEAGAKTLLNAENIAYKVDNSYKGSAFKDLVYLSTLKGDRICGLHKSGKVQIISSKGKELRSFTPKLSGIPASIAADENNNIYILSRLENTIKKKIRGRLFEQKEAIGVECSIYNDKGEFQKKIKLENIVSATGASVNNKDLIIADYNGRKIVIFNAETGKFKSEIDDMRPCCNILDFSIKGSEVLVANLGAFRVESFSMNGKSKFKFGQKGRSLDDFHGCCNPVNVKYLSNGAIITVEKDPTRVKVYSKEGAKEIQGIEELVKGCRYIPVTVDSQNGIYLASPSKGIVKCVSIN